MKREMYKTSLKLKTVDELVDIILRKDDKEREKNKQISRLERSINKYKNTISELAKIADDNKENYSIANNKMIAAENNCQRIASKCAKALTQNTLLRVIIALLGAVAIIELLIITM